jgi:hypothetical protein
MAGSARDFARDDKSQGEANMSNVEKEYYLNEAQSLLLVMMADKAESQKAATLRAEMVNILKAWRRGVLAPRSAAPELTAMLDEAFPLWN